MVALASVKQGQARVKMHCVGVMESGEELIITVKATSEAEACKLVHKGYSVEYVLEILTPTELEQRKRRTPQLAR